MKVIVSARETNLEAPVDTRFGRTRYLLLVDSESGQVEEVISNSANVAAGQGAGVQAASAVAATPAEAVISGNLGPKAFAVLERAGIPVFKAPPSSVAEVVSAFTRGELEQQREATVRGHW